MLVGTPLEPHLVPVAARPSPGTVRSMRRACVAASS